jgi:hypothetical protein
MLWSVFKCSSVTECLPECAMYFIARMKRHVLKSVECNYVCFPIDIAFSTHGWSDFQGTSHSVEGNTKGAPYFLCKLLVAKTDGFSHFPVLFFVHDLHERSEGYIHHDGCQFEQYLKLCALEHGGSLGCGLSRGPRDIEGSCECME